MVQLTDFVKVRRVGGSEVITIPKEILDLAGFKTNERVVIQALPDCITIRHEADFKMTERVPR